jgi:hypothetical protein
VKRGPTGWLYVEKGGSLPPWLWFWLAWYALLLPRQLGPWHNDALSTILYDGLDAQGPDKFSTRTPLYKFIRHSSSSIKVLSDYSKSNR